MSLLDTYNLLFGDGSYLLQRVTAAVYTAALAIRAEDAGTPNHANRLAWANETLASQETLAQAGRSAYWHVLSNVTIRADPVGAADGDIEYSVVADALPRIIPSS